LNFHEQFIIDIIIFYIRYIIIEKQLLKFKYKNIIVSKNHVKTGKLMNLVNVFQSVKWNQRKKKEEEKSMKKG
jgi:hypothetical protein